jgi:hypothetical protein
MQRSADALTERIQQLTAEQLVVVDEFVESLELAGEQTGLRQAAAWQSEPAFAAVWNNPEDDVYDAL